MIQNNHDAVDEQVGISIFKILLQVTRPKTVVLGNIPILSLQGSYEDPWFLHFKH
jgi:hypothetical protein